MNLNTLAPGLNIGSGEDFFKSIFGLSGQELVGFLIRLAISIVVYVLVSKVVDRVAARTINKIAINKGVDVSALLYGSSIIRFSARIVLLIILLNVIGVQSNTLTGIFTVISGGIALASQDIVKDFIAGISIMLTKAFAVDDYIILVGANVEGYVKAINMFHVVIRGRGDRTITVPCSTVFRASVTNLTAEGHWLMELPIGITYEDNIRVAREIMLAEARKEPLVLQDRAAEVILSELGESSVNLLLLAWTTKADHFVAYWRLLENVKLALEANGITIAYNQLDVHLGNLEDRSKSAENAEKRWLAAKEAEISGTEVSELHP